MAFMSQNSNLNHDLEFIWALKYLQVAQSMQKNLQLRQCHGPRSLAIPHAGDLFAAEFHLD